MNYADTYLGERCNRVLGQHSDNGPGQNALQHLVFVVVAEQM